MKSLKIKPDAFPIDELAAKVRAHFEPHYTVTNNKYEIMVVTTATSKAVGCKIIPRKKRLMIHATFSTLWRLALAMLILVLGGIIIPMFFYLIIYKGKFDNIEREVEGYIRSEFPDRLL